MDYKNIELLLYIAKKTKLFFSIDTSTTRIANDLKISQQTISRKLRELEKSGMITRDVSYNGHKIKLTQKAIDMIKQHYKELKSLLKSKKSSITGILKDGLGEGRYYLSLPQYKESLRKNLNFHVYPGTLNIKVNPEEIQPFLNSLDGIRIEGFRTKERTFGNLDCYKIKLKGNDAAIIIPERTRYKDIIEIIAPFNIRKKLNFRSGDKVTITTPN